MPVAALHDDRARTLRRIGVERALLPLFACAGVVGVLKGLSPDLVGGSEYYWLLSYDHGFIRRGLIGTLFRPLLHVRSFDELAPVIMVSHIVACLWIIVACWRLFENAIRREASTDARLALAFAFLCLMCSQLMPTLAHDVGYVDVYLISLVLVAFWLVLEERFVAAALVASVGPFVHEAFVFLWMPVALLLLWSLTAHRGGAARKLLAVVLPVLVAAAVVWLHSDSAVRLAIAAAPIDERAKGALLGVIFEQTAVTAFQHMMRYDFHDDLSNFLIAMAYFLPPTLALLWAALFCYAHRWMRGWQTAVVAFVAAASPLAIVMIAWDLSRFLVWSTVAAALVLLGVGTPSLVATRADA
jgi:hypothetical protein